MAAREIAGKLVLVTGAARGVGLALVKQLAAAGARPVLADVDGEAVSAAAQQLPNGAPSYTLNIAEPESFREVLDQIERDRGPLDVLVNNAGIMPIAHFDSETDAASANVIGINLLGTIYGTREAYRRMRPRRAGHIINVASIAGRMGTPGMASYSAAKFGIYGYTDSVRGEARGSGVDFSVVMPGVTDTRITAGISGTGMAKPIKPEQVAAAIVETLRKPRFEVYVPKVNRHIVTASVLLPTKLLDRVIGWTGGDKTILDAIDAPARAAYEQAVASKE